MLLPDLQQEGSSSRFGFTTLLTSQVISIAFYSEREKSDKFCSEALILACGSFMCHKSTTRDPRLYFPSEKSHTQDFYALKKSIDPGWVWTCKPQYDNHGVYKLEGDVLFSRTMHVHIWLLLFMVYNNCPDQQDPQISHQLNTFGSWWSGNILFLQSLPQPLPNCNNGCKMLGTVYHGMTFGTFMTVCIREYPPALPTRGGCTVYWCDCFGTPYCMGGSPGDISENPVM